jgi:Plavaka transposase
LGRSSKFNFFFVLTSLILLKKQDKISQDPTTHGSMLVPIILGSDKTTVSVATGQNEYYPLYISIGSIHNNIRRAHRGAVALIAFLAIPKSL